MLVFLMTVVSAASGLNAGPVKGKLPGATAAASVWTANGAELARQTLLRDGFVLRGIDGKLSRQDGSVPIKSPGLDAPGPEVRREPKLDWCGSGWFFELGSDVSDYRVRARAGTRLELLPSATLEKMAADVNERSVRLWGRVTKYKGENFIFPMYFVPLSKTTKPRSQTPKALQKPQQQEGRPVDSPSAEEDRRQPAISEPNDILDIPQEIIEKLRTRREKTADSRQRMADSKRRPIDDLELTVENRKSLTTKRYALSADSILVDRTALLVEQDDSRLAFVLNALGRNVQQVSLRLLPCEALELTERKQAAVPEPVRFKIAGIRTAYKGKHYLLLQKATRVYSHQNFDR